jgi:hypothetical protein
MLSMFVTASAGACKRELLLELVRADTYAMVLRFFLLAAVIASGLVIVQRQHVLENANLVGHCTRIATPAGKTGVWHECLAGKLTGTPGLSLNSCRRASHSSTRDVWRCPVGLESNQARQ